MSLAIVKFGGSHADAPELQKIAAALAEGRGGVVVVPGGGPFADVVRREQGRIGYDDAAAHRMALLSMAQFGIALASFSAGLTTCATLDDVRTVLAADGVPVWLPLGLPGAEAGIAESWETTSDGMAAWLAGQLDADRLIFVKRVDAAAPVTLAGLVAAGVLDAQTPTHLAGGRASAWLCGPADLAGLGRALAEGTPVGARIEIA